METRSLLLVGGAGLVAGVAAAAGLWGAPVRLEESALVLEESAGAEEEELRAELAGVRVGALQRRPAVMTTISATSARRGSR